MRKTVTDNLNPCSYPPFSWIIVEVQWFFILIFLSYYLMLKSVVGISKLVSSVNGAGQSHSTIAEPRPKICFYNLLTQIIYTITFSQFFNFLFGKGNVPRENHANLVHIHNVIFIGL